jgi:hypothetical protein
MKQLMVRRFIVSARSLAAAAAAAAAARFSVKSILYKGDDVISGTFSFPTKFTVHRGEKFTVVVGGTAGVRLSVQNSLLPNFKWADGTSDPAQPIGKPQLYTIGADGTVSVVWQTSVKGALGVHSLRINEEGHPEPYWNGDFELVP